MYKRQVHIAQGYSSADEYWKAELEATEKKGYALTDFVMDYAINHIVLKVDENGNVSGNTSGSITVTDRHIPDYDPHLVPNVEHYFDYSIEVSAQIPEKTTKKQFTVTGTIHEKYKETRNYPNFTQYDSYEIDYVIFKPDSPFMGDESDFLHVDVSDDNVVLYGLLYYREDGKKTNILTKSDGYSKTYYHDISYLPHQNVHWEKNETGTAQGVIPGGADVGIASDGITQNADINSGEDSGVNIPAAIVVGSVSVLGAGAATAAGAAAASSAAAGAAGSSVGTDGGEIGEDERRKKRYKMYIQKGSRY